MSAETVTVILQSVVWYFPFASDCLITKALVGNNPVNFDAVLGKLLRENVLPTQ